MPAKSMARVGNLIFFFCCLDVEALIYFRYNNSPWFCWCVTIYDKTPCAVRTHFIFSYYLAQENILETYEPSFLATITITSSTQISLRDPFDNMLSSTTLYWPTDEHQFMISISKIFSFHSLWLSYTPNKLSHISSPIK